MMEITCIGHSGFLVELPEINLIFDYFTDKTGVITREIFKNKPTCVFVSHDHQDHYNKEIFNWRKFGDVTYILEEGCATSAGVDVIKVGEGISLDINGGRVKINTFGSTDEGVSFLVNVNGTVLFHAGDLNCWYWADKSTPEELEQAEDAYLAILFQIDGHKIDVAFIPEDPRLGEHAGRGIQQFKEIVNPGRIVPMHFPGNDGIKY